MNRSWIGGLAGLALVACGHSEEEWQTELARYDQLLATHQRVVSERAAVQEQLEHAQAQVDQLKHELAKMGVDLNQLNLELEESGSRNKVLAKSLEEMTRAVEEYKSRAQQLDRVRARFELLRDKLRKLTELGLKVEIRRNRMVIRLPGDVLFASGQDRLRPEGLPVLDAVADVIRNDKQLAGRYFQIAGHTDDKPLAGGRFGDNWGLSVMRARRVLLYLIAPRETAPPAGQPGGGLDPLRLHAAGYGETDPVMKNDSEDGRQQNRRVELVLMPDVEEMLDLRSLI